MSDPFLRELRERAWIMADGATGTNLFAAGLESGDAPELWNLEAPEKISALHSGFIESGSDLILSNSFGGNRYRLMLHQAQERVHEINRAAAFIARKQADQAGRTVLVAGSMGPTGEILQPTGDLSYAEAVLAFREQGEALLAGGADILWAETISSLEEARAASQAAAELGTVFCLTMSFDTAGRTMMGVSATELAQEAKTFPAPPAALGANCGVGAPDLLRTIRELALAEPAAYIIAKANAGVPTLTEGEVIYNGTPKQMASYAKLACDLGARIIGGCCGTGCEHLQAMKQALETHVKGDFPSEAQIEKDVGAFTLKMATNNKSERRRRRARRR